MKIIEQENFKKDVLANPRGCYLLKGGAGTGKTHTVAELLKELKLRKKSLQIVMTAPTTTATKVLKVFATKHKNTLGNIDCFTIHSLLELIVKHKGSKQVLEKSKNYDARKAKILNYDVVVIDEVSMVGSDLWNEHLRDEIARLPNVLFIFMGDKEQFKPVNDLDFSPIFSKIKKQYELSTPMRTDKDNPARELIDKYREAAINSTMLKYKGTNLNNKFQGTLTVTEDQWQELLIERSKEALSLNNPSFCVALAYENKRVKAINKYIRANIYGIDVPQFIDNEYVVANSAIVDENDKVVIENNQEFRIRIEDHGYCPFTDLPVIWVKPEGYDRTLKVIDFDYDLIKDKYFEEFRNKCKLNTHFWGEYWKQFYSFADIRYLHAKTAHKSQGSEFNHVFIDQQNIARIRDKEDRARAAYVAASRMIDCLYFF